MARRVICISSLDGAGGEEVGRLVAERLGGSARERGDRRTRGLTLYDLVVNTDRLSSEQAAALIVEAAASVPVAGAQT